MSLAGNGSTGVTVKYNRTKAWFGQRSATVIETFARSLADGNLTVNNGTAIFTYFEADESITITKLAAAFNAAYTGSTLTRLGLYTADSSFNLTMVGRTNSNLAIGGTAVAVSQPLFTTGSDGFPTSYSLIEGIIYAMGYVAVGGTVGATPKTRPANASLAGSFLGLMPLNAVITGQTDLPTSQTFASMSQTTGSPWFAGAA